MVRSKKFWVKEQRIDRNQKWREKKKNYRNVSQGTNIASTRADSTVKLLFMGKERNWKVISSLTCRASYWQEEVAL